MVVPGNAGTNGNAYGDGRAISIGEVLFGNGTKRLELQLKGGGRTPFCRNADGRAVLRSSAREFLASEAMFHLGVATTRALCVRPGLCLPSHPMMMQIVIVGLVWCSSLIASGSEKARRPWYRNTTSSSPAAHGHQSAAPAPPDMVHYEKIAITCRASTSFIRVGTFELYARRVARGEPAAAQQLVRQAPAYTSFGHWLRSGQWWIVG